MTGPPDGKWVLCKVVSYDRCHCCEKSLTEGFVWKYWVNDTAHTTLCEDCAEEATAA